MKIPKSLLVDPEKNTVYGSFAVAISIWAFSYSSVFGQILILAYYAVWLPLILVDYRRLLRHASSAWLPLAFAIYVCLSVFWSDAPGITLRTAIQYCSHIACAYIAARTVSVRTLTIGSLIGIFLVLLYSLKVGGYSYDVLDGTYNFVGAFSSKNQIGFVASLGVYFCIVFLAFLRRGRISLFLTAPVVVLSAYMLVVAHSATSMASIPAVLALVALLAMAKKLSLRYRRVVFLVGTCGLVAVTLVVFAGLLDFVLGVFGKDSTLTGRTYLWEQGWNAAQQAPILGVGYAAYWVQGFAEAERLWDEFYITTRGGFHFHNTYIEALVELGYVGATLISLIIVRTLWGHISALIFRTWQAESMILAGVMVLLFIRSFVEVETINPYIMGSFLLYYSYFKLVRVPVARPRWTAANLAEPETAKS